MDTNVLPVRTSCDMLGPPALRRRQVEKIWHKRCREVPIKSWERWYRCSSKGSPCVLETRHPFYSDRRKGGDAGTLVTVGGRIKVEKGEGRSQEVTAFAFSLKQDARWPLSTRQEGRGTLEQRKGLGEPQSRGKAKHSPLSFQRIAINFYP